MNRRRSGSPRKMQCRPRAIANPTSVAQDSCAPTPFIETREPLIRSLDLGSFEETCGVDAHVLAGSSWPLSG